MTTKHRTRERRSLFALVLSTGAVLAFIAALAAAVGRPMSPVAVEPAAQTAASTSLSVPVEQRWGHDVLRSGDPARPKAAPIVGPGLPKAVRLATQRPFVSMPATAPAPKVPDAYRGAIPAPAKRTSSF